MISPERKTVEDILSSGKITYKYLWKDTAKILASGVKNQLKNDQKI